jgi:hypothetical protein
MMRQTVGPGHFVAFSALSALLFAPALIGAFTTGRCGAAVLAATSSGFALAVTTGFPTDAFGSMVLCGLLAEASIAVTTRYRRIRPPDALRCGVLLGSVTCVLNLVGHRMDAAGTAVMSLVATVPSFSAVAMLSYVVAKRIPESASTN